MHLFSNACYWDIFINCSVIKSVDDSLEFKYESVIFLQNDNAVLMCLKCVECIFLYWKP